MHKRYDLILENKAMKIITSHNYLENLYAAYALCVINETFHVTTTEITIFVFTESNLHIKVSF